MVAGEGYHLGGVALNSTTRETYTYTRSVLLDGVQRYHDHHGGYGPGKGNLRRSLNGLAIPAAQQLRTLAAAEEDCGKTAWF